MFVSIYNDQGQISDRWKVVKRLYQRLPGLLRLVLVAGVGAMFLLRRCRGAAVSFVARLVTLRNPLAPLKTLAHDLQSGGGRGMHRWYDLVDWVGGWPFEVATPEAIFRYLRDRSFRLRELKTCGGGLGCNEFVFVRES